MHLVKKKLYLAINSIILPLLLLGAAPPIKKISSSEGSPYTIYAYANAGSFCHRALNKLTKAESLYDEKIFFCPSLYETLNNAYATGSYAFIKVYEDPHHVIDHDSAKALQCFQIKKMDSMIRVKHKIHVYKHKDNKTPLTKIASHPDLLKKARSYIRQYNLIEIEVPGGSDEAARLLSSREFDLSTGVIGCSLIEKIFPDLICHARQVQDHPRNYEIYALIKVEKRNTETDLENVKQEILSLISNLDTRQEEIDLLK